MQVSALAYAALEWILIALLLINSLLAYAIAFTREPSRHSDAARGRRALILRGRWGRDVA